MDQATKLREIIDKKKLLINEESNSGVKLIDSSVITISSGKGGVGKTNFTVNLAISLAKQNKSVTIIDADIGLANVDVLLGIVPKFTLLDVIKSNKKMDEVMVDGPLGIKIISGGSGVKEIVNLSEEQLENLIDGLKILNEISDYIIIDTGAGINNSVISFLKAANEVIIVVTPDPTSITDAYALIKNLGKTDKNINVVVNRIENNKEGLDVFTKLSTASKKFLDIDLENMGFLYEDINVKKAVRMQKPFAISSPTCLASKGVDLIAYNLINNGRYISKVSSFNKFVNNLFSNF